MPETPMTLRTLTKMALQHPARSVRGYFSGERLGFIALGISALCRCRHHSGWDGDDQDDGYPHIRRGRVTQVMPYLGQEEEEVIF